MPVLGAVPPRGEDVQQHGGRIQQGRHDGRRGEQGEDCQFHAQKSADHGHEFDIAESHAFDATSPKINRAGAVNK